MTKELTIRAELFKDDDGGYAVYCEEFDLYARGMDSEEAINNFRDILDRQLEDNTIH
ncbi:MAG: hypothetical protein GY771_13775 [bacterium]|nr:hypothetical protein [bacterium]